MRKKRKKIDASETRKPLSRDAVKRKGYRRGPQPKYVPLNWHDSPESRELQGMMHDLMTPHDSAVLVVENAMIASKRRAKRLARAAKRAADKATMIDLVDDLNFI